MEVACDFFVATAKICDIAVMWTVLLFFSWQVQCVWDCLSFTLFLFVGFWGSSMLTWIDVG